MRKRQGKERKITSVFVGAFAAGKAEAVSRKTGSIETAASSVGVEVPG
jgi:hypothetical protein